MADGSASPLLGESAASRPSTRQSTLSHDSHESTPLLAHPNGVSRYDGEESHEGERFPSPAASSLRSLQNGGVSTKSKKSGRRWPTIVAITVLAFLVIAIIAGAFFAPAIVEEYAKQSLVVEPTNLSIHEITSTGVVARVQANFRLDATKVKNQYVRNLGKFGTWIAREVETTESVVKVSVRSLDLLVGTAVVPRLVVSIRDGHTTSLDFLADLRPGNVEGLRQVANDWLEGRLHEITLRGEGDIGLKSGIFPLGSQTISEELRFEGSDIPAIPQYNITRMNVHEVPIPTGGRGMAADIQISLVNEYPVGLTIPPLGFDILVPNCDNEPFIQLADATTGEITVTPHSDVVVNVGGIVRELPKPLTKACPGSETSPLDALLGDYLNGKDAKLFVRGSNAPDGSTPDWITKIISSITVPVPFPGRSFDNLIKEFHLDHTIFSLPSPFADIDDDDASPRISSDIMVIAGMPKEMNFGINVSGIKAKADVFYKKKMLGVLDIEKWQEAQSERIESKDRKSADLKITSQIVKAPLKIRDEDVFEEVISAYYFGNGVELVTKAHLDIQVSTVLGNFTIKGMPAEATVPIKPISRHDGSFPDVKPKVSDLTVLSTDKTTLNLQVHVNFTNPTDYAAQIPFFNLHILCNGSIIGDATIKDMSVVSGHNSNFLVQVTWDPFKFSGQKGALIGRELLSQYISGYNTTLTIKLHKHSIPHQPRLCHALSKFNLTTPFPHLSSPTGDTDPSRSAPKLIRDATFHVLSSTAQFTLVSPFKKSTIFVDHMNATALYNHTERIGRIIYDLPFSVPPGVSQSPRLPVDVEYDGLGYKELRKALGGTLKLDAKGVVGVRLGLWTETVWYVGSGIGASVRL